MNLPGRIKIIIGALYDLNTSLAHGSDDNRRELTQKIAAQACFEFGSSWGTKRADPGRPPSKDAIAQRQPNGGLWAWDWQDGATRKPLSEPGFHDIPDQVFIEVSPFNHLRVVTPPDPPVPPEPDGELEARVLRLEDHVRVLMSEFERFKAVLRSV